MEIKRYSAGDIAVATRKGNINVDDQYIRVDHAIAAGVLVPVPDGEACEISKIAICGCFLFNDTEFRLYSFSCEEFGAWQLSDHTEHLFAPDTIVQPVRLVPIAKAEL